MPQPEVVTTDRLTSRPLAINDLDWWMSFLLGDGSIDYLPFVTPDRKGSEWWIHRQLDRYARDGCGLMALLLKDTDEPIGQAGLMRQRVDDRDELEVGYHLLPEARGRGYATEAARGFIDHAFRTGMAGTIISLIHIDNLPSQRVADRNGLVRETRTEMYGAPHYVYRTT